jgi:small subunit ribosomal protein S6
MREYELVYLIADTVAEDKQAAVSAKVQKFITDLGGANIKEENLGRRRLAYEILKNEFATYVQLNFELEGSKIVELERDLKLTPAVIRHLLILKKATHVSALEEKITAVGNEELEEVIGERSFEQVEGETEESYDLMAKRDKSDEDEEAAPVEEAKKVETAKEEKAVEAEERAEAEVSQEEAVVEEAKEEKKVAKKAVKAVEKAEKPVKEEKTVETDKKEVAEAAPEVKPEKAERKRPVRPKKPEAKDEAERLRQLDEKLDQILGDDL